MSGKTTRLSSGTRLVLAIVVSIVFLGASTAGALTAALYNAGTVDAEIFEEGGKRLSLSVPSPLVLAALKLVPGEVFEEAAGELEPWWPVLREACRELARSPDAVLVHVDGPGEGVKIAKRDGTLVVDVNDGDFRVHVAVPIRTVAALLDKFEEAAGL